MTEALYSLNDKGWCKYNVENLQKEHCDIALESCKEKASSARYTAIAVAAGAILGAATIVLVSFVLAKVGVAVFVGVLSGLEVPTSVLITTRVLTCGLTYTLGLVALKKLWDGGSRSVMNHWQYASNLDQQTVDIRLHKATLEEDTP